MNLDMINDIPDILREFLEYHSTVRGHSDKTVLAYYTDLKILFKYLMIRKHKVPSNAPFADIDITGVDLDFIKEIKIEDLYRYQSFSPEFVNSNQMLSAASRCRRTSSVKSFFNYLVNKRHLLEKNVCQELDNPKKQASLPKYLEESECEKLLNACDGPFMYRDYCILMLFISCGLRISELVSLNTTDIYEDHLRVIGKGNKERVVYFDARTKVHLSNYINSRTDNEPALFVTLQEPHERLQISGVEIRLRKIGSELGVEHVHPHKFRRTLATRAIDKGMPIEQVQMLLGHQKIDTTLEYAMVNQQNVKNSHNKYIC